MNKRGDLSGVVVVTVVAVSTLTVLAMLLAAYWMGRQNGMSQGELHRIGREVDILMGAGGRMPPGTPPSI